MIRGIFNRYQAIGLSERPRQFFATVTSPTDATIPANVGKILPLSKLSDKPSVETTVNEEEDTAGVIDISDILIEEPETVSRSNRFSEENLTNYGNAIITSMFPNILTIRFKTGEYILFPLERRNIQRFPTGHTASYDDYFYDVDFSNVPNKEIFGILEPQCNGEPDEKFSEDWEGFSRFLRFGFNFPGVRDASLITDHFDTYSELMLKNFPEEVALLQSFECDPKAAIREGRFFQTVRVCTYLRAGHSLYASETSPEEYSRALSENPESRNAFERLFNDYLVKFKETVESDLGRLRNWSENIDVALALGIYEGYSIRMLKKEIIFVSNDKDNDEDKVHVIGAYWHYFSDFPKIEEIVRKGKIHEHLALVDSFPEMCKWLNERGQEWRYHYNWKHEHYMMALKKMNEINDVLKAGKK